MDGDAGGEGRQDEQGTHEDGTKNTDVLQGEKEDTGHKDETGGGNKDETRGGEHRDQTRIAYTDIINYVKENDGSQAKEDGENGTDIYEDGIATNGHQDKTETRGLEAVGGGGGADRPADRTHYIDSDVLM